MYRIKKYGFLAHKDCQNTYRQISQDEVKQKLIESGETTSLLDPEKVPQDPEIQGGRDEEEWGVSCDADDLSISEDHVRGQGQGGVRADVGSSL